jgi:hypothetical protein
VKESRVYNIHFNQETLDFTWRKGALKLSLVYQSAGNIGESTVDQGNREG